MNCPPRLKNKITHLCVCLAALLLPATELCAQSLDPNTPTPVRSNSVTGRIAARDLGALDPAYGIGNGDEFGVRQIYNTLVSPPDGTTRIQADQLQGELAETWEISPDARTWTFHLRHGVQWHKGFGEVTSDDVAFTIRRMADPKTGSQYSANYRQIESIDTLYNIESLPSLPMPAVVREKLRQGRALVLGVPLSFHPGQQAKQWLFSSGWPVRASASA